MSQQESWLSQNWYILLPFIIAVISISVLVSGLIGFQNEMQKAREELQKTLAEERKHWDSLDCAGKHE